MERVANRRILAMICALVLAVSAVMPAAAAEETYEAETAASYELLSEIMAENEELIAMAAETYVDIEDDNEAADYEGGAGNTETTDPEDDEVELPDDLFEDELLFAEGPTDDLADGMAEFEEEAYDYTDIEEYAAEEILPDEDTVAEVDETLEEEVLAEEEQSESEQEPARDESLVPTEQDDEGYYLVDGLLYEMVSTDSDAQGGITGGTVEVAGLQGDTLTQIEVPSSVTINMTSYTMNPETQDVDEVVIACVFDVVSIGRSAFADTQITSVTVPYSVTSIGQSAFEGCESLRSFVLGERSQLKTIGSKAFRTATANYMWEKEGSGALEVLDLSSAMSLETLGSYLIQGTNVKKVILPETTAFSEIASYTFADAWYLEEIVLPPELSEIGAYAFRNCESLTSIDLTECGVETIGNYAFQNTGLTEVALPDTIGFLGNYVFQGSALEKINIPADITEIPNGMCAQCDNLTDVVFNETGSVTRIGDFAFSETGLTQFDIPDTVDTIGMGAFSGSQISEISIPASVLNISRSMFADCTNLTQITFAGNSVTTIGDYAFSNTGLTTFTIPDSVVVFGRNIFEGSALEEITIPSRFSEIPDGFLRNCINLQKVNIEAINLKKIGSSAFAYTGITSFTIPKTVTEIGSGAFAGTKLTSIEIPASVTAFMSSIFYDCSQLTSVTFEEGSKITSIPQRTFSFSASLKSIVLPTSVTTIEYAAFSGCTSLRSVTLGHSLQTIGVEAFKGTALDDSFTLPSSVTEIGASAFLQVENLKNFVVPETVTKIEANAIGFTLVKENNKYKISPLEGFTVVGKTGSAAEKYASDNKLAFRDIDGKQEPEPETEPTPAVEPEPTISVNVDTGKKVPLQVKTSTTAITVSDLIEGDEVVSWESSNTKVVKVNAKGKITAKKTGTATITVKTAKGAVITFKIKVQKKAVKTKKIEGLTGKLSIKKGKTVKLAPVLNPVTSTDKITYTSSNPKVAKITKKGVIKAKKAGKATITVKSGSVKKKIKVTVTKK